MTLTHRPPPTLEVLSLSCVHGWPGEWEAGNCRPVHNLSAGTRPQQEAGKDVIAVNYAVSLNCHGRRICLKGPKDLKDQCQAVITAWHTDSCTTMMCVAA